MTYKPNLYFKNTLTRKKEEFKPVKEGEVGIYSCGPTVYWNQHIGHMYAYIHWDVLVRTLNYFGYKTNWVMNITDVGHMTGDNIGAADTGEDRMEKGAKREGISVWDLSEKYTKQFSESLDLLNIQKPDKFSRATKHIEEQINLAKKILDGGFAYETKRGLVFDTSKFSKYREFAKLSLEKQQSREDVADDPDKKSPWDFFLWVKNSKHIMKWQSPWGEGYPGWHLECTAMSTKYLGKNFDIHTGGIEHIPIHHTNEIAQGYAAFGKQTANYWLHNAWLKGKGGEKMSKSLGNFITIQELVKKGYDPLAFRYLVLNSHYRKGLNFSFEALGGAAVALGRLREQVIAAKSQMQRVTLSIEKNVKVNQYIENFKKAMRDDLNVPKALSILWEVLKSNVPSEDKYDLAVSFDEVLGLKLSQIPNSLSRRQAGKIQIPNEVNEMLKKREKVRKMGKFEEADEIRKAIEQKGFWVEDSPEGPILKAKVRMEK